MVVSDPFNISNRAYAVSAPHRRRTVAHDARVIIAPRETICCQWSLGAAM